MRPDERTPPPARPFEWLECGGWPQDADEGQQEILRALERRPASMSRRQFLQLMAASFAMAAAAGCARPPERRTLSYAKAPADVTPGMPAWYASTAEHGGYGIGVVVESREGRPTKVEGNPLHPASLGSAGLYAQSSLLQLYDPDRLRDAERTNRVASATEVAGLLAGSDDPSGARTAVLAEPSASPLRQSLLAQLVRQRPDVAVHFHAPLFSRTGFDGTRLAFGRPLSLVPEVSKADVLIALDCDLLASGPMSARHARHFAERRAVDRPQDAPLRLYVAEPSPTPTGTAADHRLRCGASDVQVLLAALAAALPDIGVDVAAPALEAAAARWVRAAAADLRRHRGRSLLVVGERQPADVHAMAALLNAALGNVGGTLLAREPLVGRAADASSSLEPLLRRIDEGSIDTLVMLGGNPVYATPAALGFGDRLSRVRESVYVGLYPDETAARSRCTAPQLHWLESWGDQRSLDGTASIVQPLIAPLYGGFTFDEVLARMSGNERADAWSLLRASWSDAGVDEDAWQRALASGVMAGEAQGAATAPAADLRLLHELAGRVRRRQDGAVEVVFAEHPTVYDGRYANVPWLQELPDPATKLTWDNAVLLSSSTAARLGVASGDWIEITIDDRVLAAPLWVASGQADETLSLSFGYGRGGGERIARDRGYDAFAVWPASEPAFASASRVQVPAGRERFRFACTQWHQKLEGRPVFRQATLERYRAHPDFAEAGEEPRYTLYEDWPQHGSQWGMTIDLGLCTGCSACMIACQAENNVPSVGKQGVIDGREMHWLRIDRYEDPAGGPDSAAAVQPMLCQHCEKAPCEYVCPVNATVHSDDGLNEMVYNRCVGTRFCSNNCPYKVRRFNWFDYNSDLEAPASMQRNPDVTVRARGVMEKCTYCVQRIRRHEIDLRSGRPAPSDPLQTACQQACPTGAILFGDLNAPGSAVAATRALPRSYGVLADLGTEPRTRYLARIVNPSPDAIDAAEARNAGDPSHRHDASHGDDTGGAHDAIDGRGAHGAVDGHDAHGSVDTRDARNARSGRDAEDG